MRVYLVNYHHLDSNSGIQIFNLANRLTRMGIECTVCVPAHPEAAAAIGQPLFEVITFEAARRRTSPRPHLIHAWTPRHQVCRLTVDLVRLHSCPYVVHMEDNEEYLVEAATGLPFSLLARVPSLLLDALVPGSIIHPGRYKQFLAGASGITMVMDSLASFCPPGIPTETIWAGFQEDLLWNMPCDVAFRRQLGIDDDECVVAYTGNVHKANRQEVASLYLAIGLLHRDGLRIKLVRTGSDSVHPLAGAAARARGAYCIELGHIPRASLPRVHSISDVLVQPGEPGPFNDYRFPSKLPEYLASGKPVLLPNTNIGRFLRDREECVYLSGGAPAQLASSLQNLLADPVLREKVGAGGRSFADRHLRPSQTAGRLRDFYSSVLGGRPSPV